MNIHPDKFCNRVTYTSELSVVKKKKLVRLISMQFFLENNLRKLKIEKSTDKRSLEIG